MECTIIFLFLKNYSLYKYKKKIHEKKHNPPRKKYKEATKRPENNTNGEKLVATQILKACRLLHYPYNNMENEPGDMATKIVNIFFDNILESPRSLEVILEPKNHI